MVSTVNIFVEIYNLSLILMLLVANLANTKWCEKYEKWPKPWHMGTHLRVLDESFSMNINMTGIQWFSKILASCALDESSLSSGRVKKAIKVNKEKYYNFNSF